ncbi:single Ig IL-1-related receptor [Arapaima gigas]
MGVRATLRTALLTCALGGVLSAVAGGTSCQDGQQVEQQVILMTASGPQRLYCPLDAAGVRLLQSGGGLSLRWLKDCVSLPWEDPSLPVQTLLSNGTAFLEFWHLLLEDQGNYTCTVYLDGAPNASYSVRLVVKDPPCFLPPVFTSPPGPTELHATLGSSVTLNCTAHLPWDPSEPQCDSALRWGRHGAPLSNVSLQNDLHRQPGNTYLVASSVLEVTLGAPGDFGLYTCTVRNSSAQFLVQEMRAAGHLAAVIGAIVLLLLLALAALLFSKCYLDMKLWYKNTYGEFEINDGKLFDAYVSYANTDSDRKFVNFILKPHLENKHGYKLYLDDSNILPGSEPSAELLMNVSRCRRLIVVLSLSYLEQEWCSTNLREGLWRLLELSKQPILITWEAQRQHVNPETLRLLRENQHRFTMLTWGSRSMMPSSAFWKQLVLVMPRRVAYRSPMVDPQTLLQDDKDPMLTLNPDYLDCRTDPDCDPAGDLGVRLPIYKALSGRAPVLPAPPPQLPPTTETKPFEVDVSDLGSRNYGARTDFYCLVTEEDV